MARVGAVSERNQPQRIPLALRHRRPCFDALYQWRWPNGFLCPHCGHDRCCQLNSRKLQQCNRCHRQTSITAGTIFDSTKLPLTVWFQAIFMTQDKKGVSAMKLHRHLGISYNAAWRHRHKLMRDDGARPRAPAQRVDQLDDAYLGGERSGGKRGRGAPGKTPFVAAVQQRAGTPVAHEAHRRRGLPSHRNRPGRNSTSVQALGSSPMGWPAFMGHRGRLRS